MSQSEDYEDYLDTSNEFEEEQHTTTSAERGAEGHKLWQDIQTLLSTEFGKVNDYLSKMDRRIEEMEIAVKILETKVEDIQNTGSCVSSSSNSGSDKSNKRMRLSSLSLQVCY